MVGRTVVHIIILTTIIEEFIKPISTNIIFIIMERTCFIFLFCWFIFFCVVPNLPQEEQKVFALTIFTLYIFCVILILGTVAHDLYHGRVPFFIKDIPRETDTSVVIINPNTISVATECNV